MQIVDNQISQIAQAFLRVQKAEHELQGKWRKPLLEVYAQQREKFNDELILFNQQRSEFKRRLRWGIWMSSILLALGVLILPGLILMNELGDFRGPLFCFSPLLILSGLTGWAIIVVLWIWQRDQTKPSPPDNPLKIGLIQPLIPLWKEGLIGALPKKKPSPDASGEYHFITRLLSLESNAYILYGLQLSPEVATDIILIGSKGVWVFDVIYEKGLIRWQKGIWSIISSNRRLAARNQYQVQNVDPPYDIAWHSSADNISGIFKQNTNLPENLPKQALEIRGGLVFSHPKGRYDIPSGCPFNWGVVPFWIEKYQSLPNIEGIDDYMIFTLMDLLLSRHIEIAKIHNPRNMVIYADQLIQRSEGDVQTWINTNQLPMVSD